MHSDYVAFTWSRTQKYVCAACGSRLMTNVYFVGFFPPGMQTCNKNKIFLDCLEYQSSLTFVQE